MVQEETPNLNVTLKGYPKKFWGFLDKVAHKTHQMIPFYTKRGGLSLTLMDLGQTYSPKCNPKLLTNKTVGLVAMVVPTAHTTHQIFVIGQFLTKIICHWLRHFC